MDITVAPGTVEGAVEPPSSKSYAQRAIAAALLADGTSTLRGVEICDDTSAAFRVVEALGAHVADIGGGVYEMTGAGSDAGGGEISPRSMTLDIGESGLSTRLFTPIAALNSRSITITGRGSILRRPMTMMIDPLRALGVEVSDKKGHLPITVRGPMRGGEVEIDGSVSSQFLTGLLIALPLAGSDTVIRARGLHSIPYIDMTIAVMDRFGVDVDHRDYEEFYIPGGQRYTPTEMTIEGDWSAAAFVLVAGAIAGLDGGGTSRTGISGGAGTSRGGGTAHEGGVTVRNLNPVSLQADTAIIEALSNAGAHMEQSMDSITVSRPRHGEPLRSFHFDASDCPDLFPVLAALAANCEGVSTIVGTRRLTHKECDRAEAIHSEFRKLGVEVDLSEDNVMRIVGGAISGGVEVDSHGDHRMAMALAVAALNASGPVVISGAECVSKSYTNFWRDYEHLRTKL